MLDRLSVETAACAAAGASAVAVRIADYTIALHSHAPDLRLQIVGAMESFTVTPHQADTTIAVGWHDLSRMQFGQPIFDSNGIWQLYAGADGYQFRFAAPFSDWNPYKVARFNADFSAGEILCDPHYIPADRPIYPLEYPLDELLYLYLLTQGRGVIVHACGLADKAGNGYLFAGQSGAGKSTMARLWAARRDVMILSDERIILSERGGQVLMHGTPWHGDAGQATNASRRLTKLFFLRQWRTNESVPLSRAEAAARLFACCFPPFHSAEGLSFTLRFFDELVHTVPAFELRFLPDASAVETIEQA